MLIRACTLNRSNTIHYLKKSITLHVINYTITIETNPVSVTEENLTDLSEILHTLPAPCLKNLALTFRLSNPGQPRSQLIDSIMKHGRQKNIGSFFVGSLGGTADTIMKR